MPISDEPLMQVIQKLNRLTKEVERLKTLRQAAGSGSSGAESFTDLDDAPDAYTGKGGQFVKVSDDEDALEFTTLLSGGTWTPVITGSTINPTVTYTVQQGNYARIGDVVFFSFRVVINTIVGGSGSLRVSLPVQVGSVSGQGSAFTGSATLPDGTGNVIFNVVQNQSYGAYSAIVGGSGESVLQLSAFPAGADLRATGYYIV